MATKIRLQRHGKKGKPFYHLVIADSRAKRDGRFIEKIGTYNPTTNPATISLDIDKAVSWLQTGAQPTDTVRSILSYTGALYKNHLINGVAKGALTEADVDKKFEAWMGEKENKIQAKKDGLVKDSASDLAKIQAAEKEISEKRAAEILAKNTPEVEEVAETTEEVAETTTEEVVAETETTEEVEATATETTEEVVEEAAAETPEESASKEEK